MPRALGNYELVEVLGKGSFGTVWRAIDTQLGRQVAVKIAHANLAENPEEFLREARAAAQLQHPNIVRVLDMGEVRPPVERRRELHELGERRPVMHLLRLATLDEPHRSLCERGLDPHHCFGFGIGLFCAVAE